MSGSVSIACILACIFSVNRWDLVGAAPTERKSRIRNNEPREPRGLTRAVKPLWLYSAAPLLFSLVLALFFLPLPLIPFHRRSAPSSFLIFSSASVSLSPRYTYHYTRCRAIELIPRIALTVQQIQRLRYCPMTMAQTACLWDTRWLFRAGKLVLRFTTKMILRVLKYY